MAELVSIIVPVLRLQRNLRDRARHLFRPARDLRDLVADLERNVTVPYELVVVCNNPHEPELVEFIRSSRGIHKYCVNSTNVGVPRAWNMGAMLAEGEYLCYSNDDVEVGPGAVETLVQVLKENDDVGEVGPKGGRWEADGSGERLGLKKIEEVDEVSGFFFVLKRKVFDEVGGFDVAYTPALFEEIDMSFRVRSLGYRCFVVPHLNIRHHPRYGISDNDEPISFLNRTISKRELQERNKKIFAEKWDQKLRKREG